MQALKDVNTATAFVAFMEEVWGGECVPSEGGGVFVTISPLYDKYHNARKVARLTGARRTGGTKLDEENAQAWEWPDGTRAIIRTDGSAVKISERKRHERIET